MIRSTILACCAPLLALLMGLGCDSGGSSTTGSGPTTASTQNGNRPTVAVIPKGTTHLHWKSVEKGAKRAADEFGVNVIWKGPLTENDASQQIGLVEQFTQEGVAGIAVAPLDANQLRRPVQQAAAKSWRGCSAARARSSSSATPSAPPAPSSARPASSK